MTVNEYIRRNLLDWAQFRPIPANHSILPTLGRGSVVYQDSAVTWQARWHHVPRPMQAASGCNFFYVRYEGEEEYCASLLIPFSQ